jgi:anti-sigma-K factor RskA
MSPEAHDRRDDLAAYLLGALEPGESDSLERHLDECERCREDLAWLRPGVEVLADSIPRRRPPPQLRARLLEQVRSDPALEHRRRAARSGTGWRRFLLRPAVSLGVVALIAAATAGYALRGEDGDDAATVAARTGGVRAALEVKGDSGTLTLRGMRPLPKDRVYQAWVQRGDDVESSSVFVARRNGTASAAIPRDLEGAERVMVTEEPRGGSEQPTAPRPVVNLALPD